MNKSQIAIRCVAESYRFECPYVIPVKTADGRPLGERYIPSIDKKGYPVISFRRRKLGIDMRVQIHQVVAYQRFGEATFAFGILSRHRDNDKTNFATGNILLGTPLDNHLDNPPEVMARIAAAGKAAGVRRRKLTLSQVNEIREASKAGEGYVSLATRFGVVKSTIAYIVTRKTYKDFPLEA